MKCLSFLDTNLKPKLMKTITLNILIALSILIIASCITALIAITVNQQSEHIDYAPDFPVYRESDTTMNALIKNEMIATGKNLAKTQRSMESNTVALLIAVVAILTGLFFNPLLLKILTKINTVDATNKEQHAVIHNELKIYRTENKTIGNLNEIVNHHLETAPNNLSSLIAHEGERLVYFASLVMNSKFDYSILRASKIQLDVAKEEAKNEVKNFPDNFKSSFITLQEKGVDKLSEALHELVSDETRNSKQNRFRMVCEQFLDAHLTGILDIQRELATNKN